MNLQLWIVEFFQKVNMFADGTWGAWASWSACSLTCGGGMQVRTRNCNNPSPYNGGATCEGSQSENQACNSHACPQSKNSFGFPSENSSFPLTLPHRVVQQRLLDQRVGYKRWTYRDQRLNWAGVELKNSQSHQVIYGNECILIKSLLVRNWGPDLTSVASHLGIHFT